MREEAQGGNRARQKCYNQVGRKGRLMPFLSIIWDLDDDPSGNVRHCLEHDVKKEEVEEVVQDAKSSRGVSRTSKMPAIFGDTRAGRHLIVIYEAIDDDTIYPITAYDVDRRVQP